MDEDANRALGERGEESILVGSGTWNTILLGRLDVKFRGGRASTKL